jgi:hypothetical protein
MNNVKVATVTICERCESNVGKTVVSTVKAETAEKLSKARPEDFFAYEDKQLKTNYRSLTYVSRCTQC